MSTNYKHGNIGNGVTLALTVPAGTAAGDVIPIGSAGLTGYAVTPIATEAGPNAAGLEEGQASVRLIGGIDVIEVEHSIALGGAVFGTQAGSGAVTYGASGDYFVGYAVGPNLVFLSAAAPAD